MKTIISIAALAALTACGPTAANFTRVKTEPSSLSEIRYSLKDPSSAEFRDVKSYAFTGQNGLADGFTVCGMVNAKNSYGGYTGFTPFRASMANTGALRGIYMADGNGVAGVAVVTVPCNGAAG